MGSVYGAEGAPTGKLQLDVGKMCCATQSLQAKGRAPGRGQSPPPACLALCLSFLEKFVSFSLLARAWLFFWKERERDCVAPTLLSLGACGRGVGEARVARITLGTGLSRASGLRPLLLHELTHPGISTPSPDSALVRCFRRDGLSPRPPARRVASAAFAVLLQLGTPPPHPLSHPGILGPLRDGEESPHPTWRCGACGCRGREEPRP